MSSLGYGSAETPGSERFLLFQVRRLQDAALQHEREKLQLQASWTQEKQLLEAELSASKEKVGGSELKLQDPSSEVKKDTHLAVLYSQLERQPVLEAELSAVTLKLRWVEEDKTKLLRDADERNTKVDIADVKCEKQGNEHLQL